MHRETTEGEKDIEMDDSLNNLVTLYVPVADKESNISIWWGKRYRDNFSVVDDDSAISTCSSLETKGREVKETAYLVFDLKLVCPVPTCRDWAVCSWKTILPWIFSLLDAIPALLQELLLNYHQYMPQYWGMKYTRWEEMVHRDHFWHWLQHSNLWWHSELGQEICRLCQPPEIQGLVISCATLLNLEWNNKAGQRITKCNQVTIMLVQVERIGPHITIHRKTN